MGDTWSKFDGYPIELYDGRFNGTFEMDEDSGSGIKYDQRVCFLVIGNASKAAISTNKDGEVKRTNAFSVEQVTIISPEQAAEILYPSANSSLPGQQSIDMEDAVATVDDEVASIEEVVPSDVPQPASGDDVLNDFLTEDF